MGGICAEYEADLLNANRLTERDYQWLSVEKTKNFDRPLVTLIFHFLGKMHKLQLV